MDRRGVYEGRPRGEVERRRVRSQSASSSTWAGGGEWAGSKAWDASPFPPSLVAFLFFFFPPLARRAYGQGSRQCLPRWRTRLQVDAVCSGGREEGLGVGARFGRNQETDRTPSTPPTEQHRESKGKGACSLQVAVAVRRPGARLVCAEECFSPCQPPNLPTPQFQFPSPLPSPSLLLTKSLPPSQRRANRKQGLAEWCGWMQASRAKTTGFEVPHHFPTGVSSVSPGTASHCGMSPHTSTTNPHPSSGKPAAGTDGRRRAGQGQGCRSGSNASKRKARKGGWKNNRGFPGDTARAACQRNLLVQILHYRIRHACTRGYLSS
ncbi:hypothetical protein MAPG_02273 [Magnaporthiopsis poae ATCC 64411]|uniref:Uncharacterized protein n=1 Tax=Magnaporthiopsis poae (strain ATCC 64411 / 73-15) TaxID=644358 RepID=A0A0C4DQX5_MAGP6|nr:hypothetical protein MAPG_02273 [Magnaporthiopsis poae ATCC 64411]